MLLTLRTACAYDGKGVEWEDKISLYCSCNVAKVLSKGKRLKGKYYSYMEKIIKRETEWNKHNTFHIYLICCNRMCVTNWKNAASDKQKNKKALHIHKRTQTNRHLQLHSQKYIQAKWLWKIHERNTFNICNSRFSEFYFN